MIVNSNRVLVYNPSKKNYPYINEYDNILIVKTIRGSQMAHRKINLVKKRTVIIPIVVLLISFFVLGGIVIQGANKHYY
jgi:hypothetical protein